MLFDNEKKKRLELMYLFAQILESNSINMTSLEIQLLTLYYGVTHYIIVLHFTIPMVKYSEGMAKLHLRISESVKEHHIALYMKVEKEKHEYCDLFKDKKDRH